VAISEISIPCEIASVVSLSRNDITTQPRTGEAEGGGNVILLATFACNYYSKYPNFQRRWFIISRFWNGEERCDDNAETEI